MSFQYPTTAPKVTETLREHYGEEIELINDEGAAEAFYIKLEFVWGNEAYVALQSEAMKAEDDVEFMRVFSQNDEVELETIADEDEWEAVSEVYDDMQFLNDERP